MTDPAGKTPVELTANIVSAYLSNNPTQASEIPNLISQVHAALLRVTTGRADAPLEPAIRWSRRIMRWRVRSSPRRWALASKRGSGSEVTLRKQSRAPHAHRRG